MKPKQAPTRKFKKGLETDAEFRERLRTKGCHGVETCAGTALDVIATRYNMHRRNIVTINVNWATPETRVKFLDWTEEQKALMNSYSNTLLQVMGELEVSPNTIAELKRIYGET